MLASQSAVQAFICKLRTSHLEEPWTMMTCFTGGCLERNCMTPWPSRVLLAAFQVQDATERICPILSNMSATFTALPIQVATPLGWRVPWYFDCRHNDEWQCPQTFRPGLLPGPPEIGGPNSRQCWKCLMETTRQCIFLGVVCALLSANALLSVRSCSGRRMVVVARPAGKDCRSLKSAY